MREKTDRRGTRRLAGGMRACLWFAITLMACIACSDENIGSLYEGGDTETSSDRGTIFRVGEMTRLEYDSIHTYFEDGEHVGCLLTSGDTLVANTRWTYSTDNGWIVIDTLWQYTYDAEGTLTATEKVGAADYDALLDTDEDGYTYTRQPGRELKLYFYYPFSESVSPDNCRSYTFSVAADQSSKDSLNAADLLSPDSYYTIGQGSATLLFKKRNAMLRVTSNVPLTNIWLIPGEEGALLSGQIDLTTGEVSPSADACTDTLKLYNISADSTEYLLILPPQTITDATLKMIVSYKSSLYEGDSTSTYKKVFDSIELQGGDLYSYNFADGVDLGLSVIWAAYNVGATNLWDYGDYYATGETAPKDTYTRANHTWEFSFDPIRGTEYDAAHVKWGGSWRMPTCFECQELLGKCTKSEERLFNNNGDTIPGLWFKGSTGDSIFFPCSGYKTTDSLVNEKYMFIFHNDSVLRYSSGEEVSFFCVGYTVDYEGGENGDSYSGRTGANWIDSIWRGAPIRPVRDK